MIDINSLKFIPLDLPYVYCDPKNIKDYMDHNSTRTEYEWTEKVQHPWNHVIVRAPTIRDRSKRIPGSGWRPDFKELFPEVVEAVEQLPYEKITYVYILEQCIEVPPHFDYTGRCSDSLLEPASYRISLLMEDQETFYICDDKECTSHRYPVFPKSTNTWAFSNKETMHGSLMPAKGKRKILLSIGHGTLDKAKHFELINQSILKYQKYIF